MTFVADTLLLFGATGDLAQRMLLPSLAALHADGLLAPDIRIIGTARTDHDDAGYRAFARAALDRHLAPERRDPAAIDAFLATLGYQPLDATDTAGFARLADRVRPIDDGLAIFLSTAPSLFETTIAGLAAAGLTGPDVRIGLEKPLGLDLPSSRLVNDAVARHFDETQLFRIDHYLGKETVQNLLALRFGNALFEPLWNSQHIAGVAISVSEAVGIETRADFYDQTGALRDMVQNHMLQLLALVAMEPPARFDAASVRDEKVKVLRALRPLGPGDSVIGQYAPGYAAALGRPSATESFVALRAHVDSWRWRGVPFLLRTGKRLAERRTEIVVAFHPVPHSIFDPEGTAQLRPNRLIIGIQPSETITLTMMAKVPGIDRGGMRLAEVPLDISLPDAFAGATRRIAYERLLLDLVHGDQTLFVRRDEVEAQWAWIDAIRAGWTRDGVAPRPYTEGGWGPPAADALATDCGLAWPKDDGATA